MLFHQNFQWNNTVIVVLTFACMTILAVAIAVKQHHNCCSTFACMTILAVVIAVKQLHNFFSTFACMTIHFCYSNWSSYFLSLMANPLFVGDCKKRRNILINSLLKSNIFQISFKEISWSIPPAVINSDFDFCASPMVIGRLFVWLLQSQFSFNNIQIQIFPIQLANTLNLGLSSHDMR